jgi:hypothetical protein
MTWKNWGDHPVVVTITVIAALGGLGYVMYDHLPKSDPDPTVSITPTPRPESSPKVTITSPIEGSTVERESDITGMSNNLPENSSMWLYINTSGEHKYYLREIIDRRTDGTWLLKKVIIGDPKSSGATYRIGILVTDNAETIKSLRSNSQGLIQLPSGKTYMDIPVNRN